MTSAIPAGVDSYATVTGAGIAGGADAETDEEYLARVLAFLRNPSRYGRQGDFALWARDASPEVSAAWEFRHFGVFGAVLVQVINGNQTDGVHQVGSLAAIKNYINDVAPPVLFDVRSPVIIPLNISVTLVRSEDSQSTRETVKMRLKEYMQITARPGVRITAGALRVALIDGVAVTNVTVKLNGSAEGIYAGTILEYPVVGEITWK